MARQETRCKVRARSTEVNKEGAVRDVDGCPLPACQSAQCLPAAKSRLASQLRASCPAGCVLCAAAANCLLSGPTITPRPGRPGQGGQGTQVGQSRAESQERGVDGKTGISVQTCRHAGMTRVGGMVACIRSNAKQDENMKKWPTLTKVSAVCTAGHRTVDARDNGTTGQAELGRRFCTGHASFMRCSPSQGIDLSRCDTEVSE